MDVHEGLFFSRFDYGYGNEWVPYIKSEVTTTMMLVCLVIVLVWATTLTIRMIKGEIIKRIWRNTAIVLMICGLIMSFFSMILIDNTTLPTIFILSTIVGGIICSIVGEMLDDAYVEELERKARWKRRRQIRKYLNKRGRKK